MTDSQYSNGNGSMPTNEVAVDSKQKTNNKKLGVFHAYALLNNCDGDTALRIVKIAATGLRDAGKLAETMRIRLGLEQVDAIGVDPYEVGFQPDEVEIFGVFRTHTEIPGHVWTREELESGALDQLVQKAAEEMEATAH